MRKCVLREVFSFSLIIWKITRSRHFCEGKIDSTMAEESAIEKKYIFYISVDPEHLCIFDREKGERALKDERIRRVHEKYIESTIETNKYAERFPEYFNSLSHCFVAVFRV